ncbi:MAG: hypothetical protein A2942_00560 [Candidatus Lloydbacteria bacterium RIFCSPLOWO2_01_FULL_50_20]|uniref:Aminoglycoside phosphotransferase domain-containing protein n=1 Tax=Candidatus Lloydbacteria bacterium RIFCSPLOWO2_01_FULL_50_20 TaxID=1798665 RepID=A0A1G2DE92_9BACT|nr:MAG: hypothetical protein A3C13_02080 [Candidatus Lloydbacteria bacterium RIFCSPHIGHO2_02_FULL_50_11]OGZ11271.1 MAG: hypothetical protein A2942_00560 [Candidatus Lloydbacteria bacterium RIFCSPLOWO2_01_FULL_50_20]
MLMDAQQETPLQNIAKQFQIDGTIANIEPFGNGRINETLLITTDNGERYVLQKLHSMFSPAVLEDIHALTRTMRERGLTTPLLVPTKTGELGLVKNGDCWRILTYISGRTIEDRMTPEEAQNGMELIGNFHNTFAKHEYEFRHARVGFHDTPSIMTKLNDTMSEYADSEKQRMLEPFGTHIKDAYGKHVNAWMHLPRRIIHGDLKLNNIRFAEHSSAAIALLDLDTLGRHSVLIDLADAARSWCNRADEGDVEHAEFDLAIFRAMMEGYDHTADFLSKEERAALPEAIAQITLELAARFLTDAYRESYFTFDAANYPDRLTQNLTKARAQFALHQDIVRKQNDIEKITENKNPDHCSG